MLFDQYPVIAQGERYSFRRAAARHDHAAPAGDSRSPREQGLRPTALAGDYDLRHDGLMTLCHGHDQAYRNFEHQVHRRHRDDPAREDVERIFAGQLRLPPDAAMTALDQGAMPVELA